MTLEFVPQISFASIGLTLTAGFLFGVGFLISTRDYLLRKARVSRLRAQRPWDTS